MLKLLHFADRGERFVTRLRRGSQQVLMMTKSAPSGWGENSYPSRFQQSQHAFAVHQVLGAAEGDQGIGALRLRGVGRVAQVSPLFGQVTALKVGGCTGGNVRGLMALRFDHLASPVPPVILSDEISIGKWLAECLQSVRRLVYCTHVYFSGDFLLRTRTTMLAEVASEEYAAVLDEVAVRVLAEAAIEGPPVDPFGLARVAGITVGEDATQVGRGRYVRLGGWRGHRPQPTVLLRPEDRRRAVSLGAGPRDWRTFGPSCVRRIEGDSSGSAGQRSGVGGESSCGAIACADVVVPQRRPRLAAGTCSSSRSVMGRRAMNCLPGGCSICRPT